MTKKATPEAYKRINDAVKEYLDHVNRDTALMINGEWGSGKTYYVKHELENVDPNRKFIYVSLNGLRSIEELETKLIMSYFDSDKNDLATILRKSKKILAKAFDKMTGGLGGASLELISSIAKPVILSKIGKDDVLVFDDLERISGSTDIKDVLGYINANYIENRGLKVIFVCNEKQYDVDGTLQTIKEKTIFRTVNFSIELSYITLKFIDDLMNSGDPQQFLLFRELNDSIMDFFRTADITNLRTIRTIYEVIRRITPFVSVKSDHTRILEVVKTIAALQNEICQGRLHKTNVEFLKMLKNGKDQVFFYRTKDDEEYTDVQKEFIRFRDSYHPDWRVAWFYSESIINYMFDYVFDEAQIQKDIEKYLAPESYEDETLQTFYKYIYAENESELQSILTRLLECLKRDVYPLNTIINVLDNTLYLVSTGIDTTIVFDIRDTIINLIKDCLHSITTDKEMDEFNKAFMIAIIKAETRSNIETSIANEEEIARQRIGNNIVDEFFNDILVLDKYSSRNHEIISNRHVFSKICSLGKAKDVWQLPTSKISVLNQLVNREILRNSSIGDTLSDDADSLIEIANHYDGSSAKDNWTKYIQRTLRDTLLRAADHIKKTTRNKTAEI